jgi:hypothetical protein
MRLRRSNIVDAFESSTAATTKITRGTVERGLFAITLLDLAKFALD